MRDFLAHSNREGTCDIGGNIQAKNASQRDSTNRMEQGNYSRQQEREDEKCRNDLTERQDSLKLTDNQWLENTVLVHHGPEIF